MLWDDKSLMQMKYIARFTIVNKDSQLYIGVVKSH